MALYRRGRPRATLLFLVLTSATVITLDFRGDGGGVVAAVRDVATDALAPVRDAADAVLGPVGDAFSGVTGYGALEDRNEELRARIEELEGERTADESAASELRELQGLLGIDFVGDIPTVAARVVGVPVSNFEQTIELDRGTSDGIRRDMPVVSGAGLVGRVVEVSRSRSVVRLVSDAASSVGVRFVDSGEAGAAEGEGAGRPLAVSFVGTDARISEDELAVTSGLEGGSDLYPAGIPVGRVRRAEASPGELEQRVELEPLADLVRTRFVRVLLTQPAGT